MDNHVKVIGKAARFIRENLKEDISVEDVARKSGYSLFHFTRMFMELTEETPGSYLRKLRLEEAAREILAGKSILETAIDYHFGSQEAFTRSFKSYFKRTPGYYRKTEPVPFTVLFNRLKGATMSNRLENLRWVPKNTTHLGCIKGCLNYLDMDVTNAWLFGATGHAFILNIALVGV
ncbi:MAG: helix-turn-helix transcriptional regulator [Dehalococcoidales bacterium]|nr:helix-turn-helix transcriptional regulator [Dehalococcoidales bacterium]